MVSFDLNTRRHQIEVKYNDCLIDSSTLLEAEATKNKNWPDKWNVSAFKIFRYLCSSSFFFLSFIIDFANEFFIFVFEDLFPKKLSSHWKGSELNIQKTSYQMPFWNML